MIFFPKTKNITFRIVSNLLTFYLDWTSLCHTLSPQTSLYLSIVWGVVKFRNLFVKKVPLFLNFRDAFYLALIIGNSEITLPIGIIPNSTDSVSNSACSFPENSVNITHSRYVILSVFFPGFLCSVWYQNFKLYFRH